MGGGLRLLLLGAAAAAFASAASIQDSRQKRAAFKMIEDGIWTAWSSCSATCGLGSKTRSRGDETDTKRCTQGPCNNWAEWNAWTTCSNRHQASCGKGERLRTRMCPNYFGCASSPSVRIQESSQKEPCLISPCAQWTQWSAWGVCSAYCDGGVHSRQRQCSQYGQCGGNATESEACGTMPCCGSWGDWESCSVTCGEPGDGVEKRQRKCLVTIPGTVNQYASQSEWAERECPPLPPCASWTEWGDWGQCSAGCGPGEKRRERTCPIPGACVGGAPEEFQPCNSGPCAEWRSWARWTICSASCGGGERTRQRVCSQDGGCGEAGPLETEVCAEMPCPEYSPWGAWGYCSEECGGGWQVRTRVCNQYNLCAGDKKEKRHCNQHVCPEPGPWGGWGACSSPCGGGFQLRTRVCDIDGTFCALDENADAASCFCEANLEDAQACNPHRCAVFGEWGAWGTCSADCGGGSKRRERNCRNDAGFCVGVNRNHPSCLCEGDVEEEAPCNDQSCTAWSEWKAWGDCSLECGGGARERKRDCIKDETFCSSVAADHPACTCPGLDHSNEQCNAQRCASWGRWARWGQCSEDCAGGVRSRERDCRRDDGFCGGAGVSAEDPSCYCGAPEEGALEEACNTHACASWVKWTHWGQCSQSCDGGVQTRKRDCVKDFSYCFGSRLLRDPSCRCDDGVDNEEQICGQGNCPFYGDWSEYGECSASCEGGKMTKTRECMVDPSYCTLDNLDDPACNCPEADGVATEDCNQFPCAIWASWEGWGSCSQVCGGGSRTRARQCPEGEGNCPGLGDETEFCNQIVCPDWGIWGRWSDCSTSCGGGQTARTRTCAIKGGCMPGEPLEVEPCNDDACPMWASWTDWGSCTVTCGEGMRIRTRACPTDNGDGCPGRARDEEICLERTCQRNTFWSDWSPCTTTCGGGVQVRSRLETLAGPLLEETQECETGTCPLWSSWGDWATCSRSCGSGQRTRTRLCEDVSGAEVPRGCVGSVQNIDPKACNDVPCRG